MKNQDKVTEQLRKNELALTDGFKDLVESNRDIITLNKELPQIEAPFEGPSEKGITYADIDNRFDRDDKIILKNYGLPKPSELMSLPEDKLQIINDLI